MKTTGCRRKKGKAFFLALALLFPSPAVLRANDEAVNNAIDRGIEYLLKQIEARQIGENGPRGLGQTALETYALVVAGVSINHPLIRKNFELLHREMKRLKYTYGLSCYVFALDAAIAQIENDLLLLAPRRVRERWRDDPRIGREFRPYLESAVRSIVGLQNKVGAWRYGPTTEDFDNSNVQFAVLALGAGAKRNVPIDETVWRKVMEHFVKGQQKNGPEIKERLTLEKPGRERHVVKVVPKDGGKEKDGGKDGGGKGGRGRTVVKPAEPEVGMEDLEVFQRGWDYQNKGGATWNMTCAGLSSLLLVRDNLQRRLPPDAQEALNKAIRDGYGWLMGHWSPTASYYGIYSLEKVADIGGVKLFGSHDWYKEVSEFLVREQRPDGSWPGGRSHGENPRVATSFALLVLNRATTLISSTPGSRIVISGRSGGGDPDDRSWVYVPELKATIHYPTLLRTLRLRPHPKLVRFLENIVENYPPEWKGELIPEMLKVRDSIQNKTVRRIIDGYLEDITGYRYEDTEDYLKWFRRWERVRYIGLEGRRDRVPDLIEYYKNTNKSVPLKTMVAWALVRCKATEAIPLFLEDLDHPDPRVRLAAYNSFRAFFVEFPPPFDPAAPKAKREEQIKAIRAWYEKHKAGG